MPTVTERRPAWQGRRKNPEGPVSGLVAEIPPFGGLPTLAFTYTLRPSLDAPLARKRSTVPSRVPGGPLCMGWSVRWSIWPYEVGHSGSPPTRAGRDLGFVRRGASCRLEPGRPTHPRPRGPRYRSRAAVPPQARRPPLKAQWDGPPGPRGPREATPFSAAAPGAPPPPGKAAPLRSVAWGHAGRQRRGWL